MIAIKLSYSVLNELSEKFSNAFYILDVERFTQNYKELLGEFRAIYPNSNIAYSYKTNYIPTLCKTVDNLGGYAEVVSEMEMELALKLSVKPEKIIFNGPYKSPSAAKKLLLDGGIVNLDCIEELAYLEPLALENPNKILKIGVRCNFDIGDGVLSRFGFDVEGEDFKQVIEFISRHDNVHLVGLHCHFASRNLDYWKPRADKILHLYDTVSDGKIEYIDLGGGIYGKMADTLRQQFSSYIPGYSEYAEAVAGAFAEKFSSHEHKPTLLIEPGTALSGDVMQFASRVMGLKSIRNKPIATLLGSIYNINPTLNNKNPPLSVYRGEGTAEHYSGLDFGGYTCIESDYLYRGYEGELAVGDWVVFDNVGSYSVVLKPPFILPNFPVIDLNAEESNRVVKRGENFDDIFHTYKID